MRTTLLLLSSLLLAACAGTRVYVPSGASATAFQSRAVEQVNGPLRVRAAVPDAQETLALTGLDLHSQGIQPVWLEVENQGDSTFWLVHKSIDPDYFSPIEVAYMNRKGWTRDSQAAMEKWFWQSGLGRQLAAGETMQGYIYTHVVPGTKGFNIEAIGSGLSWDMTFFIPMPGFQPDYMNVDFQSLYSAGQRVDLDPDELRQQLGRLLPCCSSSANGDANGLPFSLVLAADAQALRRALFRAGWKETTQDDASTAEARTHYYSGRPPDGVFFKARERGGERKELRLWMTPYQVRGLPLIVGQAVQDLDSGPAFQLDPDLNAARIYAIQSFWYGQSMRLLDQLPFLPASTLDEPSRDFSGSEYFFSGERNLLWLSGSPVPLDGVRNLLMERQQAGSDGEGGQP